MSSVEQTPLNKNIEMRIILSEKFLHFEQLKIQKHNYQDLYKRTCKYKKRCVCRRFQEQSEQHRDIVVHRHCCH